MAQAERTRKPRRPGLDGLRGLAVAAVIAYHLGHLQGGFLGVDLFFVLSGFLITGLVLDEVADSGRLSLRGFWDRRLRRLMPAVLVVVGVVVTTAMVLGWPSDARKDLAIDATATLTWWANWRQAGATSYWDNGESLFRHAWSLSIEEQFYLLWPLVMIGAIAVARRRGWSVVAAVTAAAVGLAVASATWLTVLSHRLADADLTRAYVGTDTRVLAPLAGCALAGVFRLTGAREQDRSRRVLVVTGGAVGAVVLGWMFVTAEVSAPAMYRRGGFIIAALAGVLVVRAAAAALVSDRDPLGWVVTRRLTRYLGSRSYALYLWSWPIQVLIVFRWPGAATATVAAVTIGLSLAFAEASHRLIETPLRYRTGWGERASWRRPAWAAGIVGAWALILVAAVSATPPPAHEQVESAEAAQDALRPPPSPPTTDPPSTDPQTSEPVEEPDRPLRVMVAGDSVAWTMGYYQPEPDDMPEGIESIDSRAIIGCGLLAPEQWEYRLGDDGGPFREAEEACIDQPEAERIGLEGQPDVVVLFPGAWEWGDARAPDGDIVPARSPEMAAILQDRLLLKAAQADEAGARLALVEWVCPGSTVADVRRDPRFILWINAVMHDAAARAQEELGAEVSVIEPTDEVCVLGDALGEPTPAKVAATGDEVHVVDDPGGRWIWHTWLGPALQAA